MPSGTLEVQANGAVHLHDTEVFGRQDPYCIVQVGQVQFRTRTHTDGGRNPRWNEKFTFQVPEGVGDMGVFVYNANTVTADDLIGSARINLSNVFNKGFETASYPLQSRRNRAAGDVQMVLTFTSAKPHAGGSAYPQGHAVQPGYPPSAPPAYSAAPGGYPPQAAPYPQAAAPVYTVPPPPQPAYPSGYPPPPAPAYPPQPMAPMYPPPQPGYAPAAVYPVGGYPPPMMAPPMMYGAPHGAPGYGHVGYGYKHGHKHYKKKWKKWKKK